jgi:hypothetical protein
MLWIWLQNYEPMPRYNRLTAGCLWPTMMHSNTTSKSCSRVLFAIDSSHWIRHKTLDSCSHNHIISTLRILSSYLLIHSRLAVELLKIGDTFALSSNSKSLRTQSDSFQTSFCIEYNLYEYISLHRIQICRYFTSRHLHMSTTFYLIPNRASSVVHTFHIPPSDLSIWKGFTSRRALSSLRCSLNTIIKTAVGLPNVNNHIAKLIKWLVGWSNDYSTAVA